MAQSSILLLLGIVAGTAAAQPGLQQLDPATRNGSPLTARSEIAEIARADPERAIELVQQMPLGQERQLTLATVAREYTNKDPEKALAWASDLRPPQPDAVGAVFEVLALTDPLRAFDRALAIEPAIARVSALHATALQGGSNASQSAALAEKVLALDKSQAKDTMLETLLQTWSVRSVKEAADWLVTNSARVSLQTLTTMGQRFGQRDPETTAAYIERVPSAARGVWIGGIAQTYARSDPQKTVSFLEQFRHDPAYQYAAAVVAREIAPYDPARAARLLDGFEMAIPSPGTRPTREQMEVQGAAMMTAQQWARTDPSAAAAWALSLPGDVARTGPLFAVSQVWTSTDPRGAHDWILSLPAGTARDTALRGFVGATPDPASLDPALMNAFSTSEMRQRTVSGFAGLFARTDPEAARRLVAEYVTDPAMRDAAERQIEFATNRPPLPAGLMPADPTLPRPGERPPAARAP